MKLFIRRVAIFVALVLLAPSILAEESDERSWSDRIDLSGDLRLRYEDIKRELRPRRDRFRYRARLKLTAEVSDKAKVILELASAADNPVSRNVTFDGGFSGDDIGFDLAYVDWMPVDGLNIYAGKMNNPLFRAGSVPLVWDGDLNPEGVAIKFSRGVFFGTAGYFFVEERSATDDSKLVAAQIGGRFPIGDNSRLTVGAGYFAYTNTIGNLPFHNEAAKGNSVDLLNRYIYDYKDTELFAQFDTTIGDLPFSIFAHTAQNNEVSEQDAGIGYGAKVGSAKSDGQWEASLTYQDIEADAVIGTFNDSDYGGGGTDANGYILKAKYVISKNIVLGGTYFQNKINPFSRPEEDYDRLQLDVEFKFK